MVSLVFQGEKRGKEDYPPVVVPKQLLIESTITLVVQETNVWRLYPHPSLQNVLENLV